jgi:hypothetical protein
MFVCWPTHRAPHQDDKPARRFPPLPGPSRLPTTLRPRPPLSDYPYPRQPCRPPSASPPRSSRLDPCRLPVPAHRIPNLADIPAPSWPAQFSSLRTDFPVPSNPLHTAATVQLHSSPLAPRRLPHPVSARPLPPGPSRRPASAQRITAHPATTRTDYPLRARPFRPAATARPVATPPAPSSSDFPCLRHPSPTDIPVRLCPAQHGPRPLTPTTRFPSAQHTALRPVPTCLVTSSPSSPRRLPVSTHPIAPRTDSPLPAATLQCASPPPASPHTTTHNERTPP